MDKSEQIKAIEDKLKALGAQAAFKTYLTQAYHYGRGHLYLDTGDTDNPDELKTDIGSGARSAATAYKMAGKKLIGLRPVEAVWCTPHDYETSDPLKPNWYEPQAWFAMSKQIHGSRLLKIIPHPVSDLLKPVACTALAACSSRRPRRPSRGEWRWRWRTMSWGWRVICSTWPWTTSTPASPGRPLAAKAPVPPCMVASRFVAKTHCVKD
jgi:hypothetical protein